MVKTQQQKSQELQIEKIQPSYPPSSTPEQPQNLPEYLQRQTKAYHIQNLPFEYASGLRRALLSESSSLTIDKIKFFECNCSVPEEYIALRLGLVPLYYNGNLQDIPNFYYCLTCQNSIPDLKPNLEDSKCSQECTFLCCLDIYNDSDKIITVTDRDIIFQDSRIESYSNHTQQPPIPIVKLGPTQSIKLTAAIKKGQAKIHSKWMTVSDCMLNPKITVKINNEPQDIIETQHLFQWLYQTCPGKVFTLVDNKIQIQSDKCILCDDCVKNEYKKLDDQIVANVCTTELDYNDVKLQFESIFEDNNCIQNAIDETILTLEKIMENETYNSALDVKNEEQANQQSVDEDW